MTPQPPSPVGNLTTVGTTQRQHILDTALALMSQRGVDGTSMRDLAAAANLNVASLYHYFPSKRDLLVAVLEDRGFIAGLAAPSPAALTRDPADALSELLDDILRSMLEVEDFIRLMLGEVLRGDETAFAVGAELFAATQASLERWLAECDPQVCEETGPAAVARMLRAMVVGLFFEHVAGVLDDGDDPAGAFRRRAEEAAALLRSRAASSSSDPGDAARSGSDQAR
ncbi:MAG: TetR/AcrR family transcriptional regulator [Actinomycetota bacterium]|nr:TetR/AcrR family transcriptional regulator [Actinomycetota bacterium]